MNAALVVGISDYPAPISKLPAVAADVREIGKILGSKGGRFSKERVEVLTEKQASKTTIARYLQDVIAGADRDDTIFVYMAGHGAVVEDEYFFVAHDTDPNDVPKTGMPLSDIKQMFDECRSNRLILWLDFCHSGGMIPRALTPSAVSGHDVISRKLSINQGHGKLIFAACTPEQLAYEDPKIGHGVFTAYLLEGLRGAAAHDGEVTTNSLFDFIDRKMGSIDQRPMQFGQMTGRIVLVHHEERPSSAGTKSQFGNSNPSPLKFSGMVDSTGNFCLLDNSVFEASSVRRPSEGDIVLEIPSEDTETDAEIASFRTDRYQSSKLIPFAHRSDGAVVRVTKVESHSVGQQQVWTVVLKPDKQTQGGFGTEISFMSNGKMLTPDEQARLRAGRILLNNPPAAKKNNRSGFDINVINDAFAESFIQGIGGQFSAKDCVLQAVYAKMQTTDESFLRTARLIAVFMLKATNVCEQILELKLGPISGNQCHVKFRGRRQSAYQNQQAVEIEVEGECVLA